MAGAANLPPAYWYGLLAAAFFFGLLWGSFLNVVIHRLPRGESVVKPRSRCPGCRKLIPWYRNVPVLSWIFLRARCGDCGRKISARYPAVELLTGFLFAAVVAWRPEHPAAWPFHFFFLASLVACTFIDIDHWILPDKITLPGILVGLAGSLVVPEITFVESLLGTLLGGGILYLVAWGYLKFARKEGLGGGDIKFLGMIGAFTGVKGALTTLVLSSFLGSLLGILLISLKGKKGGTAIQFGPFLALGAAAAFFFGDPLWEWYFGRH
jgi:leader peptidase (prepilin peptidase) / N-methyltransferase